VRRAVIDDMCGHGLVEEFLRLVRRGSADDDLGAIEHGLDGAILPALMPASNKTSRSPRAETKRLEPGRPRLTAAGYRLVLKEPDQVCKLWSLHRATLSGTT
jgi:hypothetical protein